jgi:H+-translocating NAD(P) transhydrogenase subunit alpha
MIVGIPKEIHEGERRVAATPETVQRLKKLGFEVWVEAGAGTAAHFSDSDFEHAGARESFGPKQTFCSRSEHLKPTHHWEWMKSRCVTLISF